MNFIWIYLFKLHDSMLSCFKSRLMQSTYNGDFNYEYTIE